MVLGSPRRGAMLVASLDQVECQDPALTGGKAAALSRLAARYAVPAGFCLTTHAYARWALQPHAGPIPAEVRHALAGAYDTLAAGGPTAAPRVAVRSSAVGEDGRESSFAGQYSSYLNVEGLDGVAGAVARCWASGRAERARAYRDARGQGEAQPMAVLVQRLVAADVAFVAFSAHPVTGERDRVVIDANWGLGESIVTAAVTPDTYVVRKADWTLVTQTVAEKKRMTVLQPSGVGEVNVPRALRREVTLSASEVCAIAQLAVRLETDMGFPVDIEGAYEDGVLHLLQCRPISVLP